MKKEKILVVLTSVCASVALIAADLHKACPNLFLKNQTNLCEEGPPDCGLPTDGLGSEENFASDEYFASAMLLVDEYDITTIQLFEEDFEDISVSIEELCDFEDGLLCEERLNRQLSELIQLNDGMLENFGLEADLGLEVDSILQELKMLSELNPEDLSETESEFVLEYAEFLHFKLCCLLALVSGDGGLQQVGLAGVIFVVVVVMLGAAFVKFLYDRYG